MSDPNAGVIQILRRTQPWFLLLSIVGFINAGFVVFLAFASLTGFEAERVGNLSPAAVLFAYPVLFLLWLLPSIHLHKYARRIRRFVAQGHQAQLESALEAQRIFWTFAGIVALFVVGLTVLGIVAAIVIGAMAAL